MFSRFRDEESVFSENNPAFLPFESFSTGTTLPFTNPDGVCDVRGAERDVGRGSLLLGLEVSVDRKYDNSTESAVA